MTKEKQHQMFVEWVGLWSAPKQGKGWTVCFYEVIEDANGYRAEQLGICANHHIMTALSLFYKVSKWKTKAGCINKGQ